MTSWEPRDPEPAPWPAPGSGWERPSPHYDPEAQVADRPGAPVPVTPPPPTGSGRGRPLLVGLALLSVLVVAGGVTAGIVLGTGDDGAAADGARATATVTLSATRTVPAAPSTVASSAPAVVVVAPTTGAADGQTYSLDGVMQVTGPAGWRVDTTAGIPTVVDYVAPGSGARLQGATFRFGIGNTNPAADLPTEAWVSEQFLQQKYGAQILSVSYTPFQGTTAVDIEYTNVNTDYGVTRHGIERLWFGAGVTYIVQSSDVAANWAQASAVFAQLTSNVETGS